jgi:hypothetical protein
MKTLTLCIVAVISASLGFEANGFLGGLIQFFFCCICAVIGSMIGDEFC